MAASRSDVRFVKVVTTSSPSWVAWAEVEVYGPAAAGPSGLATGLVSHWNLDEGTGTRADSKNANPLADNNGVGQGSGVLGQAAQFAAAGSKHLSRGGDGLTVGDEDFTFAGWFNLSSKSSHMGFFGKDDAAGLREYVLYYDQGMDRLVWMVFHPNDMANPLVASSLGSPEANRWYFVVAWHDAASDTINIQVDGGPVNSQAHAGGVKSSVSAFRLGMGLAGAGFDGKIDSFSFWRRKLTPAERTELYNGRQGKDPLSAGAAAPAPGPAVQWLVSDHLGTPRMVLDKTGSLAGVTRHDYLPFGEEISGVGGRATIPGYSSGGNVRQKFTGKERDNETGLDYFGARYYVSLQGRFVTPDAFDKDSYLDDPQSWNKYIYVRNNPLYFIDPSGQKAEVTITTDDEHKRGTINIRASFAVYAAAGQTVSKKELQRQADLLKSQIENTYTGSATKNGYTYQISATVNVQVVASEKAAISAGIDNIVEIGNRDLEYSIEGVTGQGARGAGYHIAGESFDRMTVSIKGGFAKGNGFAHEFGHLLGLSGFSHLGQGNVMARSLPAGSALTNDDKEVLLGRYVAAHQLSGIAVGQLTGNSRPTVPSIFGRGYTTSKITQAPTWPAGWIYWK